MFSRVMRLIYFLFCQLLFSNEWKTRSMNVILQKNVEIERNWINLLISKTCRHCQACKQVSKFLLLFFFILFFFFIIIFSIYLISIYLFVDCKLTTLLIYIKCNGSFLSQMKKQKNEE
jgi:hypothetical protein